MISKLTRLSLKPKAAELSARFFMISRTDFASTTSVPEIGLIAASGFFKSIGTPHKPKQDGHALAPALLQLKLELQQHK